MVRQSGSRAPSQTQGEAAGPSDAATPPSADPARHAAEVTRLEAELAAMRVRVAELEAQAERDPLTGVLNRRGFARELNRAVAFLQRYGGKAALVYLDLDDFKQVNDRNGHAAGDALLAGVAAALVAAVRASDTVARIGGDEFAVLLWNLALPEASNKALALEQAVAASSIEWEGRRLSVAVTAGVADLEGASDLAALLARADAAMYARKRERRSD